MNLLDSWNKLPPWVRANMMLKTVLKGNSDEQIKKNDERREVSFEKANLISSRVTPDGPHYPLIDLDFDARLLPSSTPGHHHLYLNRQLTHEQYMKLIEVLAEVGIVQQGIVYQMKEYGATTLRLPHIKKGEENEPN